MRPQIRVVPAALVFAATVFAAVAVSAIPADASPSGGPGAIGIRLLPALPSDMTNGFGSVYIIGDVRAGTTLTRRVEVSNSTGSTQRISMYASGARQQSGAFIFAAGRSVNQLSTWTTIRPTVLLGPRTAAIETVTIRVPRHAAPGERLAVVWAQVSALTTPTSSVRLVNRVGVRIYVTVGSTRWGADVFRVGALRASLSGAGSPVVSAAVLNLGGAVVRIAGTVTLSDGPGGIGVGPLPVVPLVALPPGDVGDVTVTFRRGVPRGPWRAVLSLSNGLTSQLRVTELTFPARSTSANPPWWRSLGIAAALTALMSIVLLALRGRVVSRRDRHLHPRARRTRYAARWAH